MTSIMEQAPPEQPPVSDEFRVSRVRALRGPNYWRLAPVIACDVSVGSLEHTSSADIEGFNDRLLGYLPSLGDHPCSRGKSGGFVQRLREGTHLPHILEHVSLELQTLAGSDVAFGRVVESGDRGTWWVIVAYEEEEVGVEAMHAAADVIAACLDDRQIDIGQIVKDLQGLYDDVQLGPSTAAIVEEARRRNIPVRRLNTRSLIQLGLGRHLRRIQATTTDGTSTIAVELAQDKEETKRVLKNVGLPVPRGRVVRSLEHALDVAEDIGYPVVLKPIDASHGRGISGRIEGPEGMADAWDVARDFSRRIIVEHFHEGRDHRVLVVNKRVIACAERVPARVVGDGRRTVAELIEIENRDPRRGVGHRKILTRLPADEATVAHLAKSGLTLDSVPPKGDTIYLRGTANLSTGGTSVDRTDEMHPDNVTACEMAAAAVGLDIAGIDVLTPDISLPFRENDAVILEVNAAPGIRMHTHPTEGMARPIGTAIVDMLYPPGSETTIPVLAVTGTNGKTTTVRLLAHLFRNTGHRVGFTTTDGVYIQNRLVMEGDMTGPFAANIILSNPTIDVAVLETARGGILRSGLGFEEADVGVVLNVTADHLGLRGINTIDQLAEVKAVIPSVVKRDGHAVLNADDPRVYEMRHRTGADIALFTAGPVRDNARVEEHVARSGIAASIEDGQFTISRGRLRIPIAAEREVPLTLGGAAKYQRQNILAAIASAYVQGMRYDDIRAGLLSFFPSPSLTPGRLNIIRLQNGARAVVDYAHNPAAIEGLVEMVKGLTARRRIAVITAPGDRRDEDIRTVGGLFAAMDHIIIRDDCDLREREPGETAGLLRDGLLDAGYPDDRIEMIPHEQDAIDRAMQMLGAEELVVVCAEKVPKTLAMVRTYAMPS